MSTGFFHLFYDFYFKSPVFSCFSLLLSLVYLISNLFYFLKKVVPETGKKPEKEALNEPYPFSGPPLCGGL